jgi:hypothetical protein
VALGSCRECGQRVSTEAIACPHCGVPSPVVLVEASVLGPPRVPKAPKVSATKKEVVGALIIGLLILSGVGSLLGGNPVSGASGSVQPDSITRTTAGSVQPDSITLATAAATLAVPDTSPEQFLQIAEDALRSENFSDAKVYAAQFLARHSGHPDTTKAHEIARLADSAAQVLGAREEAAKAEQQARRAKALASMRKTTDRVHNITFYQDRSEPQYRGSRNWMGAYIGAPNGPEPYLRLLIQYVADDWLFIESYNFLVDGSRYTVTPSYGEVERDNGSGQIWEWYDAPARPFERELLDAIAGSKEALLRYNGSQYRHDRTISASEKAAIRRVLDAYDALAAGS